MTPYISLPLSLSLSLSLPLHGMIVSGACIMHFDGYHGLPILAFNSRNASVVDIHLQGLFFDPCTQWLLQPTHAIGPSVVSS